MMPGCYAENHSTCNERDEYDDDGSFADSPISVHEIVMTAVMVLTLFLSYQSTRQRWGQLFIMKTLVTRYW